MKQSLKIIFVIFSVISAFAQKKTDYPPAITIGESIKLQSSILNEDYTILVDLPPNYGDEGNTLRYPVLYLLDGKYYFSLATEAVGTLATMNGNGVSRMPAMIVVAITSNNRDRDYTPKPDGNWQAPQRPDLNGKPMPSGGADVYLQHIEKEVIPYIDKNYRTQPFRVIAGHSLGGLMALYIAVKKPELFQAHILGDPSVWWNNGSTAKAYIEFLKNTPDHKGSLVIFRPWVPLEYWFPINKELKAYLESSKPANLLYSSIELENETHMSVIYPGLYFALRDMFKKYRYEFHPKASIQEAKKHYDSLSAFYGYKISLSERLYEVMRMQNVEVQNDPTLALSACQEWIKDYPNSARAHLFTGKTFLLTGDKRSAQKHLQIAQQLSPENPEIKTAIAEAMK